MTHDVYAEIDAPISCPKCGEETAQKLLWLEGHESMACSRCDAQIDLTTGEPRKRIVTFRNVCDQCVNYYANRAPGS